MTAIENIMLPMTFAGTPADEARNKAFELCDWSALTIADNKPSELSGGQQQQVAVAARSQTQPLFWRMNHGKLGP